MKRMMIVFIFVTLMACFFPGKAVLAEERPGNLSLNRHIGPYAEANAGYTFAWITGGLFGTTYAQGAAIGFGWTIGGGYMFNDWAGAEAGYLNFRPKVSDSEIKTTVGGFYLTSRFNIPIQDRFSLIFKIGAMTLSASAEATEFVSSMAPFTGVGLGYALTDNVDLRVQFQGPNLFFVGAGVLSGGIAYRF